MNNNPSDASIVLSLASIFVIYTIINYTLLKPLVAMLTKQLRDEAARIESEQSIHEDFIKNSKVSEERAILEIETLRSAKKFDISIILAEVEFILITILTFVALNGQDDKFSLSSVSRIFIFSISWLAVKTFGNFGQWKFPNFGRSIFDIYLITSVINIMLGIVAGWILAGII